MKTLVSIILLLTLGWTACTNRQARFELLDPDDTGIRFRNDIAESDSVNPLDLEFLYNGGGVAVGDLNGDSLPDLYFTGSQVANHLYLNEGDFRFREVAGAAGAAVPDRWSHSATIVDINADGRNDIYICASILQPAHRRANLLLINQGNDEAGIPRFRDEAASYNLADTGHSVHTAFFDYDRDGDLDMYLLTTEMAQRNSTRFDGGHSDPQGASPRSDRLYRNEGSDSLGHPRFRNVSQEVGIGDEGYGLGISIVDINRDGWKDIYVTNDFYGSDLLYVNTGRGTFVNRAREAFQHTSANAMGQDAADVNNDGLVDLVAVDMNPEDNYRKKKNINSNNYSTYQGLLDRGFVMQFVRNTLQVNRGNLLADSSGNTFPFFSEIAFYAGVAETDWSWSALLADMDNDGYRDLMITNGYPRDVTDHDFGTYRMKAYATATREELLSQIPQIKIPNYAFRNNRKMQFEDVTPAWNMMQPSFSNGAVYADLDRDGDLDYVINNINDVAMVYRNHTAGTDAARFLRVQFSGRKPNPAGIGAYCIVYYEGRQKQVYEHQPVRGYLSQVESVAHFGLGSVNAIDSLVVIWPDGSLQRWGRLSTNQVLTARQTDAQPGSFTPSYAEKAPTPLFSDAAREVGLLYRHEELDHVDFNVQKLMPTRHSQTGPVLATGDVDGNGLTDLFIGTSAGYDPEFWLQQSDGKFKRQLLPPLTVGDTRKPEVCGAALFDADGDGDPDLYLSHGSSEWPAGTPWYKDRFYRNDGEGVFTHLPDAIPDSSISTGCVRTADVDADGDLDLFVAGRLIPGRYPESAPSLLLRNDSQKGNIRFQDVSRQAHADFSRLGLVTDALWTDINGDKKTDLLVVGEWMKPRAWLQDKAWSFKEDLSFAGKQELYGMWNCVRTADLDSDGDMDYLLGNIGANSFFWGTDQRPLTVIGADFDKDGVYDAIPFKWMRGIDGGYDEFPAFGRDDFNKQMISFRRWYPTYKAFGEANKKNILQQLSAPYATWKADYLKSVVLWNNGSSGFDVVPLAAEVQWSSVQNMLLQDWNGDGQTDVLLVGNDFGMEVGNGWLDAGIGTILLGTGGRDFRVLDPVQAGLMIRGDCRSVVLLPSAKGGNLLIAAQNRLPLLVYRHTPDPKHD